MLADAPKNIEYTAMSNRNPTARTNEMSQSHKAQNAGPGVEPEDTFPELALEHRVDSMILWGAWPGEDQDDPLSQDTSPPQANPD
jgi:hypothetical protein